MADGAQPAPRSSTGLWLLGGTFLLLLGAGGVRQSFGVFVHPLEMAFGGDRAQVAIVAALSLLVFGIVQPLSGWLIDRQGPGRVVPAAVAIAALGSLAAAQAQGLWLVALLYGLVASAGFGAISNAPLSGVVARSFTARRGLALGICAAGVPLGQLVMAPTLALLINAHDWRAAMSWTGLGLLVVLLPLAWWLMRRESGTWASNSSRSTTFRGALSSGAYRRLSGAYVICGMTTLGLVHTHLVPYTLDLGIGEIAGARVLGLVGLFNMAGLIGAGLAADRFGARVPLGVVYGTRALALVWLALAADERMLVAFAAVFGLTDMATIPLTASMTARLFGRETVGGLYGLAAVGHQIGSALGAWLAGLGYTLLGAYQPIILVGAGLALAASLLAFSLERHEQPTLVTAA